MLIEFECPKCKGHLNEKWSLDAPSLKNRLWYWHWLINPALALNELILGQRIPTHMFVCKSCPLPLIERNYLYCPNCYAFHPSRIWHGKNALGKWLGIFCPICGSVIPCLWNFTSRLILILTAPVWFLPIRLGKSKWSAEQRKQITQRHITYLNEETQTPKPVNYKRMATLYSVGMFIISTLLFPTLALLAIGQFTLNMLFTTTIITALFGLIIFPIAGYFFQKRMRTILEQKGDSTLHLTFDSDGKVVPLDISSLNKETIENEKPFA